MSFSEIYAEFERDTADFMAPLGAGPFGWHDPAHLFAFFFQVRRAFTHIYEGIIGGSLAVARLRAAVWQSIFTHDLRRYVRVLFDRMGDLNTLVTGPSGTGKELVAWAIGSSRYLPFDPKSGIFAGPIDGDFHAVNLSALSPTLIESELFGHRKGAFTGALADRAGWFEVCGPTGAVFLDEIGEIDPSIQVKLLRVLEDRTFVPLGDSRPRRFTGKVIAATNRDLSAEMREGRFREDLYYRLCADVIETPSLESQLREEPEEIRTLVRFLALRLVGEGPDLDRFVNEVVAWLDEHLGPRYPWPGNFRELEQCVRNLLLREDYRPAKGSIQTPVDVLLRQVREAELTAEDLLGRYVTLVYARTGSYEAAGRVLELDRRTVRRKVDPALLENLAGRVGR